MIQHSNTLDFVLGVIDRLARADIHTWLSGGWAEELHGMRQPQPHRDVDLLYPTPTFARLDAWLPAATDLTDIPGKRFSHKRAFLCEGVMIETVLLEPDDRGAYHTSFFDGRYRLDWPHDSLGWLMVGAHGVPIASRTALRMYRHHHERIALAYQSFCQQQEGIKERS